MKLKLILSLTIITFFSCKKDEDISFNISNIKETTIENQKFQLIRTKLTNHTKDTIEYYGMSCSNQDFYFLNNNELFMNFDCNKNIPIIIKLLPKESNEVILKLRKSRKIYYSDVKIGFFLYRVNKNKEFDFKQINSKSNLIMSNSISFEND